jgi:hypothetical protein
VVRTQGRHAAGRPGAASEGEEEGSRSGMAETRRPVASFMTCVDAADDAWCELARRGESRACRGGLGSHDAEGPLARRREGPPLAR